jgi:predicted nucleic acid-binding protein
MILVDTSVWIEYLSRGGWVDVHLLASARSTDCALWSFDHELTRCAEILDIETA